MSEVKSLKEIVEALVDREYVCENGELVDDTDFRFLAEFAGVKIPTYAERVAERLAIKSSEAFKQMGITLSEIFKTDQQRRDEIVERSKRDIIELQERMMSDVSPSEGNRWFREFQTVVDFVVNREKRTVVALLKLVEIGENAHDMVSRGIAKCHPDDCFNAHIGKAIALRRALGLEVPDEYLNTPQPTEVRVGDVVEIHHTNGAFWCTDTVIRIRDDGALYLKDTGIMDFIPRHGDRIIDDSREGERE